MDIIIFLIIAIILISFVVYLTVKRNLKCNQCFNRDITPTGQKRYKEDSIAIQGSPNSYHELEYKCNKCGNVFWAPKEAAIFN
jgi:hypothetical protein